jgi:hypothetical protein
MSKTACRQVNAVNAYPKLFDLKIFASWQSQSFVSAFKVASDNEFAPCSKREIVSVSTPTDSAS